MTAVALVRARAGDAVAAVAVGASAVQMRGYTDAEIAAYISTGDPFDKAGAYAIQHLGFRPVAAVRGCYLNVVGFPLCRVGRLLTDAGLGPGGSVDWTPDGSAACRLCRDACPAGVALLPRLTPLGTPP